MRVFIFGAGASYGAHVPKVADRSPGFVAPLVYHLFDPHYDKSTHELLTPDQINRCGDGVEEYQSLEKYLTERWGRINSFQDPKAQNAERAFFGRVTFSLWFLFQHVSTYEPSAESAYDILLTKLLSGPQPGLISFNYDTLLDRAI